MAQPLLITPEMYHLRNTAEVEWSVFPINARDSLNLSFDAQSEPNTLALRQIDVRQLWKVTINGDSIGVLDEDENDITKYFTIPKGTLRVGQNLIGISCLSNKTDDILVGNISLYKAAVSDLLKESAITFSVTESNGKKIPSKITIVNDKRSLQPVDAKDGHLPTRTGYVLTATGEGSFTLPAGTYTLFASRGFEYGVDSTIVTINEGQKQTINFELEKEVDTENWISMDPHVHTFTNSHHGDATLTERAITLAAEDVEVAVLTDHNFYTDLRPVRDSLGLQDYFTPIVGDELTTVTGHFNVFPIPGGVNVLNKDVTTYQQVLQSIQQAGTGAISILNHGEDIHNDFRPFDTTEMLRSAGYIRGVDQLPVDAMEVLNSGSQQSDYMRLYEDWMGFLSRGILLTPIGSSDSHDVSRYVVGQGRTYVKINDRSLNIDSLVANIKRGRVAVSSGIFVDVSVDVPGSNQSHSTSKENHVISVRIEAPKWSNVENLRLYINGISHASKEVKRSAKNDWSQSLTFILPNPGHDFYVVAIAEGRSPQLPFWPIAKPYQATSKEWVPRFIGSTRALWIDSDENGKIDFPVDYAKQATEEYRDHLSKIEIRYEEEQQRMQKKLQRGAYAKWRNRSQQEFRNTLEQARRKYLPKVLDRLSGYDEGVARQAATELYKIGGGVPSRELETALLSAKPHVQRAFEQIIAEINRLKKHSPTKFRPKGLL